MLGRAILSATALSTASASKPRSPKALLELCEKVYTTFSPARLTLDSHAEECVVQLKITNPDEAGFVKQVLYGVVRYQSLLKAFTTSFYYKNSGEVLRGDVHLYKIFAYITIFRLEELSFPQFRRLVNASDPQKMIVFLRYLFDEENLKEVMRDDWLKIYDKQFVDSLINGLLQWNQDIATLMEQLSDKVYITKKKEEEGSSIQLTKKYTECKPFNLTKPKPKPPPLEEAIPDPIKPKQPPPKLEGPTKEERAIEAAKAMNRKEQAAKYSDPRCQPFTLKTLERPTNIEHIREELEHELMKELTFKAPAPRQAPEPSSAQVKLTATSILREDAVYKKKQMEEAELLERYEKELRDHSEFTEWQKEMLDKDEADRKALIEKRRLEMAEAQGAAMKARENMIAENLQHGREQKAGAKRNEANLKKQRLETVKENSEKRSQVIAERTRTTQALEKLAIDKKLQAEAIRQQELADAKKLSEEHAKEIAEKKDIIRQLKALEKVPRKKVQEFDPTEVVGHGLLDEMSLLELKERLRMARNRQEREVERQRVRILQERQERESMLMDKASNIHRVRTLSKQQANDRRREKKRLIEEEAERAAAKHKEARKLKFDETWIIILSLLRLTLWFCVQKGVLTLNDKLTSKRSAQAAEKSRLLAEEKRIRFEQQQQAAGASQVEEQKFHELRKGAARELVGRQDEGTQAMETRDKLKAKEERIRLQNVRTQKRQKKDFLQSYDEKVRQLKSHHKESMASDQDYRKGLATKQKTFEATQRASHDKSSYKPFSQTHSSTRARLAALAAGQEL
ncbi:hypothetical protein BSKO_04274 [Bryopsis sp. KO-2023]|nr:hypothetical protein BSKO_04274 [Bryopsis sp. KO-2023]